MTASAKTHKLRIRMALFGKKKKKVTSTAKTADTSIGNLCQPAVEDALIAPRVTEKAAYANERGVYVFNVAPGASKSDISRAVYRMYNVSPRKVNLVKVPGKQVRRRNVRGYRSGGRKAYVYLKKGDKIELM